MAQMSKKIHFHDDEKLKNINPETMRLWNKYLVDMSIRELSPKSVLGYTNDIQHWFIYIYDYQGNQCITDLTEDDVTEFLFYCKSEGNNSRRMKRRMSSISAFYKFLRRKKLIKDNPLEFFERPKKDTDIITQTFLTKDQVNLMREKLIESGDLELYTYAMFSLSTMARVNAVSNLMWKQIDFEERVCNDVIEKEGYIVSLYFSEEVKDLLLKLKEYRTTNNINDGGYVFYVVYKGEIQPISNGSLNEWCKKIGNMIGVPTLHPHDFRHSGSNLLKNEGMNLEDVSNLLNHSSTDVTQKFYLRPDKSKIQANKDKFKF